MRASRFWSSDAAQGRVFYTTLGDIRDARLWLGAQL